MNGWMYGRDGRIDGWMEGWIAGWMDEWMNGWMDGWMDGYKRNFGLTKFCRSENSRLRNFADTVYGANRLNLMRTLKPALL